MFAANDAQIAKPVESIKSLKPLRGHNLLVIFVNGAQNRQEIIFDRSQKPRILQNEALDLESKLFKNSYNGKVLKTIPVIKPPGKSNYTNLVHETPLT